MLELYLGADPTHSRVQNLVLPYFILHLVLCKNKNDLIMWAVDKSNLRWAYEHRVIIYLTKL